MADPDPTGPDPTGPELSGPEPSGPELSGSESTGLRPSTVGWSVLLAPGWWHIKVNGNRARSVRALVERVLADRSRDAVAPLRRALTAELDDLVERAAQAGASDVYLFSALSHGLPVAATCIATVIPRPLPVDVPAGVIAETLTGAPDEVPGILVVDGVECPTTRRAGPGTGAPPEDPDLAAETMAQALPSAQLDVYVGFPDGTRTLLLSFATTIPEPAQAAMTTVFEAIAESLRWTTRPAPTEHDTMPTQHDVGGVG